MRAAGDVGDLLHEGHIGVGSEANGDDASEANDGDRD